ncbi:MAG: multiheme c-type cytochrome [Sulfurimonas sp.]
MRSVVLNIILIFISGILQMELFSLPWIYFRLLEFLHIAGAIVLVVFFILPFLYKHIKESIFVAKQKSRSGVLFGITFLVLIISGGYLFLIGNRGGDIYGIVAHYLHLYGSFALLFFLFVHIKKILPSRFGSLLAMGMLIVLFPWKLQSENLHFSNIELEKDIERYHNNEWRNSVTCKVCHSEIFNEWADSNHRHLADSNPYYMVMENLAGMDKGEAFREWCMGCHNPSAVTTKQTKTTHFMRENSMPDPLFVQGSAHLIEEYKQHRKRLEQGVSCIACHRMSDVKEQGNSSYRLSLHKRKRYLFGDATSGMKLWLNEKLINANPKVHKKGYMQASYQESRYCASCHNEFLPHSKKMVVATYDEWRDSPYNNQQNQKEHKSCQDCHMSYIKDGRFVGKSGRSTKGGVYKKQIKTHYFSGANHFLVGLKSKEHEAQSIALLKTAAKLDAKIVDNRLFVGVTNVGAGHHLPTGAADFRELWLHVTVRDGDGKKVFESGDLDESGNIKPNTRIYQKVFGDKDGKPVGLFFWRYEKLLKDNRIPAKKRVEELFILPQDLKKPLDVVVELNFRIYPQWVTDIVKAAYPSLPNPPVVTISKLRRVF